MRRPSAAVLAALVFSTCAAVAEPTSHSGTARELAASKLIDLLTAVQANLRESRYSHATRVDERVGLYEFDCSGLAAWALRRTAKKAHGAVVWRAKGRPLARDYYYQIAATKPDAPRHGWQRVGRVSEARAGDVIAWLKPKELRSANTGHVAFLVDRPRAVPGRPHAFLVRVADASRYQHQDDSRTESGRTGFGLGSILVIADPETGAPLAYGWAGLYSAWVFPTKIAIGRVEG